ncbi:SIR2 family protein [Elusimicrobiota bacterium]
MSRIVLFTGAGFTHNFGTPLASEMWHMIYNSRALKSHKKIKEIMRKEGYAFNYEQLYFEICQNDNRKVDVSEAIKDGGGDSYKMAVESAYERIDKLLSLSHSTYDVDKDVMKGFILEILGNEKYFFTINQDLFIERKLRGGFIYPGIDNTARAFSINNSELNDDNLIFVNAETGEYDWKSSNHYYIKLHGSWNWVDSVSKDRIMVIGGEKSKEYKKYPLIKDLYFNKFRELLNEGGTKLLIIGYGFMDHYINNILIKAISEHNLEILLISPEHPKILYDRLIEYHATGYKKALKIKDVHGHMPEDASNVMYLYENITYWFPNQLKTLFPLYNSSDMEFYTNPIKEALGIR